MCGIAGCYQQPGGESLARAMSDRMAHRGPDASGLSVLDDGRVSAYLAHRRLSIIDLSSAADQPLSKQGLTIAYNGELYNYRELRRELVSAGVTFITNSDTEVVLEAWRRWGPSALSRFRGMFAFALLDTATGHLFLARDPLGIKPLHYFRRGDGLLFASELKSLLAVVGSEVSIDPGAMVASMLYYWVPDQQCVFQGIRKLPAGTWAEARPDGTFAEHTYWRAQDVAADAAASPRADLQQVIEESVAAHMIADVPVSTFLSGGLDSSIITVLAQRAEADITAYTIAFRAEDQAREAMPDDARFARKLAAQFGIRLNEIEIAPDIVDMLPRIVDVLDEPIGDPAAINTLLMCEAARDAGIKVLLSGMGADELFGGYRKHAACVMGARYRGLPAGLRNGIIRPAVSALPVAVGGRGLRYPRWAKRFLDFAELPEEAAFRRSYTLYDGDELGALLSPEMAGHVNGVLEAHSEIYADTTLSDHVNRMCLTDSRMFMAGLNLTYTDRASMAASTEVRTPFVDPVVFHAAFTFTGREKINRGKGKLPLKQAAAAWLPDEIINRPKASFSAPLRAWISRDLREIIDDSLMRGELVNDGILARPALTHMVESDRAGSADYSKNIWQLLTMELWYRNARSRGVDTSTTGASAPLVVTAAGAGPR
jgi:asparagine synthase (glutamine-hydrolysing)